MLRLLALLSIGVGVIAAIVSYGWLILLAAYFIGFAVILFLLDSLTRKTASRALYWSAQGGISLVYVVFLVYAYLDWSKHTVIILSNDFQGSGAIVFGIEGYPELPEMKFWKRSVELPPNGLLITSTREEELPKKFAFQFEDGSTLDLSSADLYFTYASDYPCILTPSVLKNYRFTLGEASDDTLQELLSVLCDSINAGELESAYTSEHSLVVGHAEVPYLDLQNEMLSHLPENINQLPVKKIILTGNKFTAFPEQLLHMPQLEVLLIGHNPLAAFPADLGGLKNLKRLSVNATAIRSYPPDLSALESLETIGLDHNELTQVPEAVLTLPNLRRLVLNSNALSDLSFIDDRLSGLESIYLQSNAFRRIGCEISRLRGLKELLIFANEIDSIPDCIGGLTELEKLEIWENPIVYVSPEIRKLTKLKSIRMEKDGLTEEQMEQIRVWLPNAEIHFQ